MNNDSVPLLFVPQEKGEMWWVHCESRSQAGLASLNSKFKTSNAGQKTKSTNALCVKNSNEFFS